MPTKVFCWDLGERLLWSHLHTVIELGLKYLVLFSSYRNWQWKWNLLVEEWRWQGHPTSLGSIVFHWNPASAGRWKKCSDSVLIPKIFQELGQLSRCGINNGLHLLQIPEWAAVLSFHESKLRLTFHSIKGLKYQGSFHSFSKPCVWGRQNSNFLVAMIRHPSSCNINSQEISGNKLPINHTLRKQSKNPMWSYQLIHTKDRYFK